jgi:uncharacterized protein YhaN
MRLRRLDLTRYGKFTDHVIDFGAHTAGQPDLHLVYGPNEAGKSTALSAYLDLLYGIEPRSNYNFLHAYQAMRIGVALEIAGKCLELVRIKRPQNSLLDADGQVVGEPVIQAPLGGIDRESYRARFSLDDDTLEAGGDAILQSQGDLGQALFSASAGLADLSRTLASLREEADQFYRPHGRATELAELKAAVARLKQERDALDTVATKYAALVESRDNAARLYADALRERATLQAEMNHVQRLLSALPRLASLRALRAELLPLAGLPDAPGGWAAELPALRDEETTLATLLQTADQDIAGRTDELNAIVIDAAALGVAEKVDAWADARARAITAGKDIPERQLEVHREDREIAGILARLGRPAHANPPDLILPSATVGAVRALLEQYSGIEARRTATTRELAHARDLRDTAAHDLRQFIAESGGLDLQQGAGDALAAAIRALRNGEPAALRHAAARALATCRADAAEHLRDLHPWRGDLAQLAGLIVPDPARVQAWKTAQAAVEERQWRLQQEAGRLREERLVLQAETTLHAETAATVSDPQAAALRAAREAAWASHRQALDAQSADLFEAAMRQDDIAADARARHAAETETLRQATRKIASLVAQEAIARENLAAAQADAATLRQEIDSALAAMSSALPPATTPAQLESWLAKRDAALHVRERLLQAEAELQAAETDHAACRSRLIAALTAAAISHNPGSHDDDLLALAQTTLDRATAARGLRRAAEQREAEFLARQQESAAAAADEERWQTAWAAACQTDLLHALGSAAHVATVREILETAGNLGPALERRALLLDRIQKMRHDEAEFARQIAAVAQALGIETADTPPLALDRQITARVQAARTARDMAAIKSQELQQARQRRQQVQARAETHARRKAEMTAYFAVDTLPAVADMLRRIELREDLRRQAAEAERDIIHALRVPCLADAEAALDEADRTALEAQLSALHARFEDGDRRVQTLFSEHRKAIDQVESVGGDSAVATIEARRKNILLDIEERAKRHLKLRAGIAAAERALQAYRRAHRSFMMQHASEAFRTISRGAYTGLSSQPERDGEVLVALCADGGSKIAPKLSKGTRFQLYLALRVAGYREFAKHREPVPFIADDIMETFDDFRADAALRVLADMANTGQVIYLTHHRHLCDIARDICPQIRLHTLVA